MNARDIISLEDAAPLAPVAAPPSESGAILSMIERAARDPNVDIEKFERLMAMRERVGAMQERADKRAGEVAFSAAVSAAKGEIEPITRNATGHNDKKYADFGAIARAVDPILAKNGLSYRFRASQTDKITVTCVLAHTAGHIEENTLSGSADTSGSKNAIQAIGSTLTYLQRYTLVLALGLATAKDDDGRAAAKAQEDLETISPEQLKQLTDRIRELNADAVKFREVIGVESFADIYANKFDAVMAKLNLKARKPQ